MGLEATYGAGANLWGQDPLWGRSMGLKMSMGLIYGAGANLWGWDSL